MDDLQFDGDLLRTAEHVEGLARAVPIDPRHQMRLRSELLQKHAEMTARSRIGNRPFARFLRPVHRVRLVAPAALAVAVAASATVWGLQVSGHPKAQPVEAQKLSAAMVRTVPTVTGWRWGVTQHLANSARFTGFKKPSPGRVYVYRYGNKLIPYLWMNGQWKGVPSETSGSLTSTDWLWAFAQLPIRLAEHRAHVVSGIRTIAGKRTVGVRYQLSGAGSEDARAVAWVELKTGRILLLEREVYRGSRLVEEDWARYTYQQKSTT